MTVQSLVELYDHQAWADATVWRAVLASDAGRKDAKLRSTLYHIHLVQRAFLRAWLGEPREAPYPTFEDTDAMLPWARSYGSDALRYLASLTDHDLSREMPLPWAEMVASLFGRPPATSTLGDTVLQVPMHSQYHRGQVNARLREVGGEPPLVDYIAWVWLGRPEADWSADRSAPA